MSLIRRQTTLVPEGDGVEVKRLFPLPAKQNSGLMNFDPFVLWDHFDIHPGRGFPDHPHRGFEAITYMFEGGMKHKDNLGNESFVSSGGAQRFTAGSGIIHSEMPASKGKSNGIQLWINLPRALKKIKPDYQQVDTHEFPLKQIPGGEIKILLGEGSPLKLHSNVIYQHARLKPQAKYTLDIPVGWRGLVYLLAGKLQINSMELLTDQALFVEQIETLEILAEENSQLMICFGLPHGEVIHQHGPFVD